MQPNRNQPPRRSFIKRLAFLGGALFFIPRPRRGKAAPAPNKSEPSSNGYRLTPHIRKYYETAAK